MTTFQTNTKTLLTMLTVAICLLSGCTKQSQFPVSEPTTALEFGHGGGFAGIEYRFVLLPDGRLFKQGDPNTFIKKVSSNTTTQLFQNIRSIASTTFVLNDPGNTYEYINFHDGESKARFVWNSDIQSTLGSNLELNHSILMNYTKMDETN